MSNIETTQEQESNPVHEAALLYISKNWQVFPLKALSKEPDGVKWRETRATLQNAAGHFPEGKNIAVALGEPSGGLVDLDFDTHEAGIIGKLIFSDLPSFGRKSSPLGHRVAYCPAPGKTKQFGLTAEEGKELGLPDSAKLMVLEVRSTGSYTMFPPSTHPSGEVVKWQEGMGTIPTMDRSNLDKAAGISAALAVVLTAYPTTPGNRNAICMALAGALVRADIPVGNVDELVVYIAQQKGDEEADKRRHAIETHKKLMAGEEVTGLPKLCDLLGISGLTSKLHKWLYGESLGTGGNDPVLALNDKFFVVASENGKCRVAYLEEYIFERGQTRDVLVLQSFEDFRKRYCNIKVEVGVTDKGMPITKKLGDAWLDHAERRQYERIVFSPGQAVSADLYNLWQGFSVEPQSGSWEKMRQHVLQVLAQDDEGAFNYIIKWAAWAVQNPDRQAEVALVFKGGKGTGKGTFCRGLKNLFGQHGLQIFSSKHITGNFNGHLRDCVLLFADEAIVPNDTNAESTLKGLLTEPCITIERKGVDAFQAPNHLHVVMASNSAWVVPASADERRFAVFDVSSAKAGDKEWFVAIDQELQNGGMAAMLHDLLNIDLEGWHPRGSIPANAALLDQRIQSLQGPDAILFDWLVEGDMPGIIVGVDRIRIPTTEFASLARIKVAGAGRYLGDMGFTQDRSMRPSGWISPPLAQARLIWDRKRFSVVWDDQKQWCSEMKPPF